jgi:hypothetical protein
MSSVATGVSRGLENAKWKRRWGEDMFADKAENEGRRMDGWMDMMMRHETWTDSTQHSSHPPEENH